MAPSIQVLLLDPYSIMQYIVTSELNFASSAAGKVNVFTSQPTPLLHIYAEIAMEGEHSDLCGIFQSFSQFIFWAK